MEFCILFKLIFILCAINVSVAEKCFSEKVINEYADTVKGCKQDAENKSFKNLVKCVLEKYGTLNEKKTAIDFNKFKATAMSLIQDDEKKSNMGKEIDDCKQRDSNLKELFLICTSQALSKICGDMSSIH